MLYYNQHPGSAASAGPILIRRNSYERGQAFQKALAIYYAIVLLVLLVLNLVFVPWLTERQVQEVDYGTFMSMTQQQNIGKVDIQSNQIVFTDKEEKQIYKTGLMDDPGLTQRLYDAGAQFSSEIVEQGSPVLSFLIWFALPILLFSFIGNQMNKKLMEKQAAAPVHDVWRRRQVQRQGLCAVHPRHPLCGCGRRGRGQGEPAGDRQLPPRPQAV